MYGHQYFRWLMGDFHRVSGTTADVNLSDADAAAGELGVGIMLDFKADSHLALAFVTGSAIGFTTQAIDQYGTTSATVYRNLDVREKSGIPFIPVPVKKGQPVALSVPEPWSMAEFEGLGAASYGNRVITATTTGFLSASTARRVPLSVERGGWKEAQTGELVLAFMEQSNLTPYTVGNIRIRVRFCSPYLKP